MTDLPVDYIGVKKLRQVLEIDSCQAANYAGVVSGDPSLTTAIDEREDENETAIWRCGARSAAGQLWSASRIANADTHRHPCRPGHRAQPTDPEGGERSDSCDRGR
jgi:hypothetical protein